MNTPLVVALIGSCFSALAAALCAVSLSFIASLDRRVGTLEKHAMEVIK